MGGGAERTCADRSHQESSMRNVRGTFRNIPRKLPRKLPQESDMRNIPGTFRNIPRKLPKTQACGTFLQHSGTFLESFLEHSGTFLGRTESDAHIPYCIFVPYRSGPMRSRPFFFFFSPFVSSLFFSFLFTESAIPGRQHHIPSDL